MFTIVHSGTEGRRGRLAAFAAALIFAAIPASSQTAASHQSAAPQSGEYAIYEINPFGGYQWFQIYGSGSGRVARFEPGAVVGIRFNQDFTNYLGLEESLTVGFNRLSLRPYGTYVYASANEHNYNAVINPMLYFTKRESKVRPFVTVGPGVMWYVPSRNLVNANGAVPLNNNLEMKYGPALMYGVGVKFNVSHRVGLRFDLRDTWTQGRYFGIPQYPYGPGSVYSPPHGSENSLALTGGLIFRFGYRSPAPPPPPPPAPPPPPPAPKAVANIRISGISGARDVCPGDDLRLNVSASGWLADQTPSYQWIINDRPVPGANGSSFSVPTADGPGTRSIVVRVSVPNSSSTSDSVTVRVKDSSAPVVRFALSQTQIPFGTRLPLSATAQASECTAPATVRYSASEGSVAGDVFDSSTVSFDMSNRLKQQTKVVHITATATDAKGGTNSATADVTVVLNPEARRLDDIVFPANSARVNNCAKRLLLEQVTPMLREDPNATVILIGHRDEREKGAANLDRTRVLNAAAVLSAGTGICPQLELSRVKANWVGTDQSSTPRPALCGTSTDVKERSGQGVSSADQRAQFRRVEVWIVPGGAAIPEALTGLKDLPAPEVQRLGCPK